MNKYISTKTKEKKLLTKKIMKEKSIDIQFFQMHNQHVRLFTISKNNSPEHDH